MFFEILFSGKGLQDGITSSSNSSPQSEKEELLAVLMMKRQEDFTSKRSFRYLNCFAISF